MFCVTQLPGEDPMTACHWQSSPSTIAHEDDVLPGAHLQIWRVGEASNSHCQGCCSLQIVPVAQLSHQDKGSTKQDAIAIALAG